MMRRSKQAGIALYAALAALVVFGGMSIAIKVQTSRLESVKQEYAAFRAKVDAEGRAAEAEATRINAENAVKKEKIDRENKTLRAANSRLAGELRDARARSRFVPEAAPGAGSPATAAFDRAELERTLQRLDAGVSGIVAEGDQARLDLDSAREWARK